MKTRPLCLFLVFALLLAAAAPASDFVRGAWLKLADSKNGCPEDTSLFPAGGAKTLYCHLKTFITLKALEEAAGVPVFLSGAHAGGKLNLQSETDFGRYNPQFVRWLIQHGIPAGEDLEFREATRPVYDAVLKDRATLYLAAVYKLDGNPQFLMQEMSYYLRYLAGNESDIPKEKYGAFFNRERGEAFDAAHASQAVAFWLRRAQDGTMALFKYGLESLMKTYDKDTLEALQRRDWSDPGLMPVVNKVLLGLPGSWHGNEVFFKDKDIAYGLYAQGGGFLLRRHTLGVDYVKDNVYDLHSKEQKTGKEVKILPPVPEEAPLAIIKAPFLNDDSVPQKGRAVASVAFNRDDCLHDDPNAQGDGKRLIRREIPFSKNCHVRLSPESVYTLKTDRIMEWATEPGAKPRYKHTLILSQEGRKGLQTLTDVMDIVWMGDLDGDGKLDLLIDERDDYNSAADLNLFLSSYATGTNLVGLAARFLGVGC